ncbi:MAG: nucleotidyl transferase AbiEii/AbiGii toxin family protein [Bacteriovoracaceae bacterium]|jgi:predicted nucleotidyltransferase component of viral defense system|nr:nucleotidyl transferase AbiEii/AbiGii toxin family protein [Bacteriovoracaceae bacterium]
MIPRPTIIAWRKFANWPQDEQVEQDLIISRALIEIFNHPNLKDKLAFRGGTALHKLIFPNALRYSEDIDLNRLEKGANGEIISSVKEALKSMLGKPIKINTSFRTLTLYFRYNSCVNTQRKIKIEINCRETLPKEDLFEMPYSIESEYFNGSANIKMFCIEEMIGTKIRALYQREKGRDLFDLYQAREIEIIDWAKVVDNFLMLEDIVESKVTKSDIEKNLSEKMKEDKFVNDIRPLLPSDVDYNPEAAYRWFVERILPLI